MSVSGIRSRVLTHQSAISFEARRDAVILPPECVACPLWTASPQSRWKRANKSPADKVGGVKRLFGRQNLQRRVRGVNEF